MKFIIHYKEIKSLTIILMQIGKNMVETPKLVYVIILFLSIILGMTVCNSSFSQIFEAACKTDKDCPYFRGSNVRCRKGHCTLV